jgi:hypothetical protein
LNAAHKIEFGYGRENAVKWALVTAGTLHARLVELLQMLIEISLKPA